MSQESLSLCNIDCSTSSPPHRNLWQMICASDKQQHPLKNATRATERSDHIDVPLHLQVRMNSSTCMVCLINIEMNYNSTRHKSEAERYRKEILQVRVSNPWRDPMKSTSGCRRVITLSLMSILSAVVGTGPAHSQSAVAPGSEGSHSCGSQETLIPPKSRDSHANATKRSMRPPDIPDQTTTPNMRARTLEERLRSGQMERPI